MDILQTFTGTVAIIYIVLTIIGLLFVFSILKWLLRKIGEVWSHGTMFGGDLKTRLISLGVVAIIFPSMFYFLGNAIIQFIGNFFVDVPLSLVATWQTNYIYCGDGYRDYQYCVGQLLYGFIHAWTSAFSDALKFFGPGYISYSKLVLMLAVWAGIAMFLSAAPSKNGDSELEVKTRLQIALDRLSATAKQNIMFFIILVFAGYLSIAAIAAIPGLQETAAPSEAVSVERLEQQLTEASIQSQARIPQELQLSDPFETLESDNGFNDNLKLSRKKIIDLYPILLKDVQAQTNNLLLSAISAYRVSVIDRKGTQETIQHFINIDTWYRRTLAEMESQVRGCGINILSLDDQFRTAIALTDTSSIPLDNPFQFFNSQNLSDAQTRAYVTCRLVAAEPIPERPDLGSNLGPFSYIASWLLQTESLPLAQIVGLLGFGLLGSAVSSLVRDGTKKPKNKPLVEELATVIIRGATAAVVVFLAVKGGLAIFTTGESEPNSYVLLLTCLVAAVFSERVWEEAEKRLNKGLSGEDDQSVKKKNNNEVVSDSDTE